MNTPGAQLARDKLDRFRSLGAFGKPAYQSHVQLRAMLLAQRDATLANYFARPVVDAEAGELRWHAPLPGEARRVRDLGPDEAQRAVDEMRRIRDALLDFIAQLRRQGGSQPGGAAAFASLLEQALKVPEQGDFRFVVGTQPVIAFWGFEDAAGASVDPAAQAPLPTAPAAAAPVPAVAPTPEPLLPPAAAPVVERKRRGWWWLLALLLALGLIALLLFLQRACTVATPPGGLPDTTGRKAEKLLEIPPGALERGDLSFLEGAWQLGEERLRAYQGRPDNVVGSDRLVLRFGKDGTGTNHAVERLRHGKAVADCSGGLSARTDGKKLMFERLACNVPGQPGLALNGSKHECLVEAGGKTMCYGINQDGVRWEAPLRRLQ